MHPKAGEPVGLPETPSSIDLYKKQDLCTYWNEQTPRAHHVTLLVPYPGKSRHPDHPNLMSGSESGPRGSPRGSPWGASPVRDVHSNFKSFYNRHTSASLVRTSAWRRGVDMDRVWPVTKVLGVRSHWRTCAGEARCKRQVRSR